MAISGSLTPRRSWIGEALATIGALCMLLLVGLTEWIFGSDDHEPSDP